MALLSLVCRIATLAAIVMAPPVGVLAQSLVCCRSFAVTAQRAWRGGSLAMPRRPTATAFRFATPRAASSCRNRGTSGWSALAGVRCARDPHRRRCTPVVSPRVVPFRGIPVSPLSPPIVASDPAPPISVQADACDPHRGMTWRARCVSASRVLVLFAVTMAARLVPSPRPPPDLQRAGEAFVGAFVRPLIDPGSSVPPVLVRLRFIRRSEQLEIHLAPNTAGATRTCWITSAMSNTTFSVCSVCSDRAWPSAIRCGPRVIG